MTNLRFNFATIVILMLLVSCVGEQTDKNQRSAAETPKALQDNKVDLKSYSRSGDLVEQLYGELVDQTPELKKLEDDFVELSPKRAELNEKFLQYGMKSNHYYSTANNNASAVTDSLLRKKMIALITASQTKYTTKTTELNSLLAQMAKNGTTLSDHHAVLKIVLTLPIIEKYQSDHRPDAKEFKELMGQQENLLERTVHLTPKY